MTPEQIRKTVEDFPKLLGKKEKLQNRLIKLSGRDPEQEMIILQQLEALERTIEFIDYAIFDGDILSMRESCILERRTEGLSPKEIAKMYSITRQSVDNNLNRAFRKMVDEANKQNIS